MSCVNKSISWQIDRCTKDTSKHVVLHSRTYKYGWFDMIRNSTQQKNYLKDILEVVTFTRPSIQVNVNVPEHFTHVLKKYSGAVNNPNYILL